MDVVQALWKNHQQQRTSPGDTRQLILNAAGGIESPSWYRRDSGLVATGWAGDAGVVPGVQLSGRSSESDARGVGSEPTPAAAEPRTPADITQSTARNEPVAGSADARSVPKPRRVRGSPGLLAGTRRPYQRDGRSRSSLQGFPSKVGVDGIPVVFAGFKTGQDATTAYMDDTDFAYLPLFVI